MIIDTHSHIHFKESFPDIEKVLENARAASVGKQILVGCNLKDSLNALEFVQQHEGLYLTIGIHPHDSTEGGDEAEGIFKKVLKGEGEFREYIKKPVAIGEIGLDYFKNFQSVETQKKAFKGQLQLAREFDLPVIIHAREAFDDIFEILQEEGNKKVLLHCFSGGIKEAQIAWERGYLISFAGVITYPKNDALREVARIAPADLYVVETDCPFLAPQKYRGQRNEPAFVVETVKQIAEVKGVSFEEVAKQTTANALSFFRLI